MRYFLGILLMSMSCCIQGQELTADSFDFWLGEWDLTWVHKNGSHGKGSNRIIRILDDINTSRLLKASIKA
jgi:hypothetical protein